MHIVSSKKVIIGISIFIFLLILLPLTVFLARQQQSTKSSAAEESIAIYKDGTIMKSDLSNLSQEFFTSSPSSLTPTNIKILLNAYIERKILQKEGYGPISNQAEYENAKQKLIKSKFKIWSVSSINFWLAPTDKSGNVLDENGKITVDDTELTNPQRKKMAEDVNAALDLVKKEFEDGAKAADIASTIIEKYPDFAGVMGVNSYTYNKNDGTDWDMPVDYNFDSINKGVFYETLYKLGTSDIGMVNKTLLDNNMGGTVFKLVNFKDGEQENYESWLTKQLAANDFIVTDISIREAN